MPAHGEFHCQPGKIIIRQYRYTYTDLSVSFQGFSLGSAITHSPKIIPDVREFAVLVEQFVGDEFWKPRMYGNAP